MTVSPTARRRLLAGRPELRRFMGVWAVLDDCGGALGPLIVGVLAEGFSVFHAATAVAAWALVSTAFFCSGYS